MAIFMADAFETGDAEYIAKALGVVASAKGMTARQHVAQPRQGGRKAAKCLAIGQRFFTR